MNEWTVWLGGISLLVSLLSFGVSGAAYRRTLHVKKLDLRLELRKLNASLHADLVALPARLEAAEISRERINAARGMLQSGAMQRWRDERAAASNDIEAMNAELPAADETFAAATEQALEDELVRLSSLKRRIDGVKAKYEASLADDRHEVDVLRQSRMHAKVRSPFPLPRDE